MAFKLLKKENDTIKKELISNEQFMLLLAQQHREIHAKKIEDTTLLENNNIKDNIVYDIGVDKDLDNKSIPKSRKKKINFFEDPSSLTTKKEVKKDIEESIIVNNNENVVDRRKRKKT